MSADFIAQRARLAPDRPAVRWRGRWHSYAEMNARAERLAGRLAAEGVKRGDRVAILALNHLAHLDLVLAAPKLGFVYAPLNYRLSGEEQKDIVALLEPALLLHDRAHTLKAEGLPVRRLPLERYADWLERPVVAYRAADPSPEDLHMLLLTGGSTGLPKAAQIPYRQVLANAVDTAAGWLLTDADCAIQATPAFHAALNVLTTPLLHQGGRVVLMESFDAADYLALAAAERATVLFMVPTMFQMLAEHPAFATADLGAVRYAIAGGAPCPPTVHDAFAARGIRFKLGYGMTECGVNCFALGLDEAAAHPQSVGRPMPQLRAVIRDADGAPVPPGTIGELTLAGPQLCAGYWRRPAETAAAIRDGWLWTGDLARQDESGLFFICGRRKEMYISGGENVYPAEVEAALVRCRNVAECAVIGVPHPRWGETGLAVVVARTGARLDGESLRRELKDLLAGYKLPGEFMIVEALPKTGAGKIDKPALRRRWDAARSAA